MIQLPPEWMWNENQQVGTDYADVAEVERYDRRMSQFRDFAAENGSVLAELGPGAGKRLLEIGTGTGNFARAAARAGYSVVGVDISPAMLEYAAQRARAENVTSVSFERAGFLSLPFEPGSFDAAVSSAALHHLPDVWKFVALRNLCSLLKPGGRFVLRDVVFSPAGDGLRSSFASLIELCPEDTRAAAVRHVAREFSTLDWIMEGLLEQAGFRILNIVRGKSALVQYSCERGEQ